MTTQPNVGLKTYRKVQGALEATCGTPLAATHQFCMMGITLDFEREIVIPEVNIGTLFPPNKGYVPKIAVGGAIDEGPFSFQESPIWINACLNKITGATDLPGSGIIREWPFEPTAAQPAISTYTIEAGDNVQAYETDYAFVPSFNIGGESEGPVNFDGAILGREWTATTFTPALTFNPIDFLMFGDCKLFIDDTGVGFGTTLISDAFVQFSLAVSSYNKAQYVGNGAGVEFAFVKRNIPEITLEITLEGSTTSVAELDKYKGTTPRAIRIEGTGPAVQTGGGAEANSSLIIDCAGIYTATSESDSDNNIQRSFTLTVGYDVDIGNPGRIKIVNEEVSTILP